MMEEKEIQGTEAGKQGLGKEGSEKGMKVYDDREGKCGKRMERDVAEERETEKLASDS